MSSVAHAAPTSSLSVKNYLLVLLGLAMMAAIALAPTPVGLSLVGQRVIAVMSFIVFMWITEAITYGVSAIALIFLLIVSLGFSPPSGATGEVLGTG